MPGPAPGASNELRSNRKKADRQCDAKSTCTILQREITPTLALPHRGGGHEEAGLPPSRFGQAGELPKSQDFGNGAAPVL
jgi:hypothetical protein